MRFSRGSQRSLLHNKTWALWWWTAPMGSESAESEVVGDEDPVEVAQAKPDSREGTVYVSRNLEHDRAAPSSNADNTSFAGGCEPGVTQAGAQDEGMHQDVHAGNERADSIFTNQDYQQLIQQDTQEMLMLESKLRFLLEAIPHKVTRFDLKLQHEDFLKHWRWLKLQHEDLLKHRRRIYGLVRMSIGRWVEDVHSSSSVSPGTLDKREITRCTDHQLSMQLIEREIMALEADLRFLLEAIPYPFTSGTDLKLHYEDLHKHRERVFGLLAMCFEQPDLYFLIREKQLDLYSD